MPQVYNGIGTWYYGKKNVVFRDGTCSNCGHQVRLKSYDTRLWFVVLMIPVIPLKRKHVIDECSNCTRHVAVPLAQWQETKAREMKESFDALKAAPDDPKAVKDQIITSLRYHERALFETLAATVGETMQGDAEVQKTLGAGWVFFNELEKAEPCYRRSLAVRDDPEVREALAMTLCSLKRPAEARLLLQHILDGAEGDKAAYLLAVAQCWHGMGRDDEAMDAVDETAVAFPALNDDKQSRRLWRSIAEKVSPERRERSPFSKLRQARPKLLETRRRKAVAAACLVALALGVYAGLCVHIGARRTVHVVNGLDKPYTVRLNGREVSLPAGGRIALPLGEGAVKVEVAEPALHIKAGECRIHTPFWTRPFGKRVFVINPDRAAVLAFARATYVARGQASPEPEARCVGGRLLDEFSGVDYPFEEFPDEIRMSGSRKTRSSVQFAGALEPALIAQLHALPGADVDLAGALRAKVMAHPDDAELLASVGGLVDAKVMLGWLEERLDERPVLVNWHRLYQGAMQNLKPEVDLLAQYRAWMDAEPKNADLEYLYGRLLDDPDQAEEHYRRATAMDPPSAFAWHAMAYQRLSEARFEEALELSQKACASRPDDPIFAVEEELASCALGRFDAVLDQVRAQRRADPARPEGAEYEVVLLAGQGRGEEAQKVIDEFCAALSRQSGVATDDLEKVRSYLLAAGAYARGDVKDYAERVQGLGDGLAFRADVEMGRVEEAASVAKQPRFDAYSRLVLYVAAQQGGEAAIAEQALSDAVAAFRTGDADMRWAADAFARKDRPDPQAALRRGLLPAHKRILLTALGLCWPEDREAYFALARKLNFENTWPKHFLARVLGQEP